MVLVFLLQNLRLIELTFFFLSKYQNFSVSGSAFGVQKMLKNDIHGNVGSSRSALSKAQNSVGQPQTKPLTSSSSREQTDEDELLSGVETVENLDPADAKRVKR